MIIIRALAVKFITSGMLNYFSSKATHQSDETNLDFADFSAYQAKDSI